MATTGFWPVKGRLKDVINYAQNPDKTTDRRFLDDDLAATLNYVENSDKTDQTMYVSGINCTKKQAYEQMMTTKRRYGKLGGNVAYHGYQSFQAGEVSPEEAHRIGIETAKRMWGDNYEIVVTTHLNTDHLHNHIVVNSVSFRTGRKFENHISDHYKLREISDEICREYGKSVIENAPFYGGDKAYWVRKSGRIPHKDMLRHDVDEALACTIKPFDFEFYLRSLGYQFVRNFKYQHPSVIAPDWRKPVRLSSLGKDYTREAILRRLQSQREDKYFVDFYTPKSYYQRQPLIVSRRCLSLSSLSQNSSQATTSKSVITVRYHQSCGKKSEILTERWRNTISSVTTMWNAQRISYLAERKSPSKSRLMKPSVSTFATESAEQNHPKKIILLKNNAEKSQKSCHPCASSSLSASALKIKCLDSVL